MPTDTSAATDAPARSLLKNYQLRITPTATELYTDSVIHIQTPQGLQALGNIVLPWKPDTDVLTVHKFKLLRGKQEIDILANGQKFEVMRRENNLEYATLDGILTAALQPAGMEVGDVLDLAFTVKREYRLIPAPEIFLVGFIESPPAERIEVRALWDKSLPLKWRATPEVVGIKESRSGSQSELRWATSGLSPIDQPNNAPARFWREPLIEFTTYKSWNEVSQKLAPLYANATELAPDSAVKKEAAAIAAASTDPVKRLEAALKLAQDRVRYVFLGMAEGGVRPASADETWQRRFGDCKGKSALLIALLRELGIEAEPVAVNTRLGDAVPNHLPGLGAFDHVLVRAQAGGRVYWLDGASQGSWRRDSMVTPGYRWGLPLTARGDALVPMVAEAPATPQLQTDIEIDAHDGLYVDAPFKVTQTMQGAQGAALHAQLAQMTPAIREQALKKYWKNEWDFVEPKTVREEYDADSGVSRLIMEGTAVMDWGDFRYVTDHMRTGSRSNYKREAAVNADAPFLVSHPLYQVARERIVLPAVGEFSLSGKNYDTALGGYKYVRRAKIENRVFTGESSAVSLVPEIPAAEARAAGKTLNDMWADKLEIVAKDYWATEADAAALGKRKFDDRPNLVWRGNVFMDRGDYQKAFDDFDAAAKLEPDNATVLANRGLSRYWLRDYPAARKDFDAALAKEPRNAIALRGLGVVEMATGKLPEAIAHLTASLNSEPDNTFALKNRGQAYGQSEQTDKALADYAEAIRISPTYVDMYSSRAWLMAIEGRTDDALKELDAMVKACPDSAHLQWSLADNYWHMGRYPEAVAAMDRAIAADPIGAAYLNRARVRDPADVKGRLADIDAALAKEPDDEMALWQRAEVLGESGDHAAAIAAYTAQIKKTTNLGGRLTLTARRGVQYWQAGKQAEARKDFAAVIADQPDSDAYNTYCWTLATARIDLPAALSACDKALKIAPNDAAYHDSRGLALLQLGRVDEAIAAYDAALALRPKLGPSLYGRALARNRRCNCHEADADLEKARRLYPGITETFVKAGFPR